MATQIGRAHIHGLTGGTLGITNAQFTTSTTWIVPNMQSLRLTLNAQIDRIKNQSGDTSGLISSDEFVECEFDILPEDTSSTYLLLSDAIIAAYIPKVLSGVTITGLPVVVYGPFADVFNTSSPAGIWIYEGGSTLNGPHDGKWTATLPLKRYPSITVATAAA